MRRTSFFGLGLLGVLALSCQVFPSAEAPSPVAPDEFAVLPPVAAGAPAGHLADTIALVEGATPTPADERLAAIRFVAAHLDDRHTGLSSRGVQRVAETIVDECEAHGVELDLVLGVIQVESAGYHRAVSHVGAMGLMQIMPATGKKLAEDHGLAWPGPELLFDPVINVQLGIAYLQELSDRYDHVPTALAAYNWGPGRIDSRIRRGVAMPQLYVEQVMRAIDRFEMQTGGGAS